MRCKTAYSVPYKYPRHDIPADHLERYGNLKLFDFSIETSKDKDPEFYPSTLLHVNQHLHVFPPRSGDGCQILCQLHSASPASSSPQPRGPCGSVPPPDLNCKGRMAVFRVGPQPRGPRISTASSGWQCPAPDLNRQLPSALGAGTPQPTHNHKRTTTTTTTNTSTNTQSQTQHTTDMSWWGSLEVKQLFYFILPRNSGSNRMFLQCTPHSVRYLL